MLAGIPFLVTVGDMEARASTDERGTVRICYQDPVDVHIEELTGLTGGQWYATTPGRELWHIGCGDTEVWIGNAQIGPPRTGSGGVSPNWHAGGGPQEYM
jgi:hypothetical protein